MAVMVSKFLMYGSVAAAGLAGIGALGYDLYLASTQWVLVGILLAVWAAYSLVLLEQRR